MYMLTEHKNTASSHLIPDEAWDVFLPDGGDDPLPDEGDFWFELDDNDDG